MLQLNNIPQINTKCLPTIQHELFYDLKEQSWDLAFVKYCAQHHKGIAKILSMFVNLCDGNDEEYKKGITLAVMLLKAIDIQLDIEKNL